MGVMFAAVFWGFAEATVFFIVPDVLLTFVAVRVGFKRAAAAALAAGLGAMAGGGVMFLWARHDPVGAFAMLARIPGIPPSLIQNAGEAFQAQGWPAVFRGAFAGVPYKIYAVEAGSTGAALTSFLALTLPARLPRFLLGAAAAAWAGGWIRRRFSNRAAMLVLGIFWVVFYGFYFRAMRG